MAKKNHRSRNQQDLHARLNKLIQLLEDPFIPQAVTFEISRDHVRAILGVRTTRISGTKKGVKQARKHAE